ncbi:MAG TPA: erythromycin esterase family protein [Vicinamibacterales bacterium]|nr:erythromycin esterase family protein [Vicinamibacterales bacterium]
MLFTRVLVTPVLLVLLIAGAAAQNPGAAWVSWAREHHHPIAAIHAASGDTFADLQFLKALLGDRRIVQLGESGHGVAEFNHAKVRLIQFLHQQMGFDVLAFESGLVECYNANRTSTHTPLTLMRACIFGVWHTSEVLPLFEYIKSTQGTDRPLTLAGFDTQISSASGITYRPPMFADMVRVVEPARAPRVLELDQQYINALRTGGGSYAIANESALTEFYGGLELLFQERRAPLSEVFPASDVKVAERAAWSMLRYLEQLRAGVQRPSDTGETGGGGIRDFGMANNLTFLANDLYAGRKIIVWAHNFHIRHDNTATVSTQPTMGKWVRERFRDQLYTIGLYMNQGTAAMNNRVVYPINPAQANTMEWVMAQTGSAVLFMDFLHQRRVDGNSWMFEPTRQREWGTNSFTMVPRDQYDGVLFIDTVKAPAYLQ